MVTHDQDLLPKRLQVTIKRSTNENTNKYQLHGGEKCIGIVAPYDAFLILPSTSLRGIIQLQELIGTSGSSYHSFEKLTSNVQSLMKSLCPKYAYFSLKDVFTF